MGIICMFVLGVILYTPGGEQKFTFFSSFLLLFWISCGIVPGWKALSGITANTFLILPILGWVFYFIFKVLLALAIGWIILPFKLAKDIIRFVRLGKIQKV